jgi:hypothetical protein
MSCHLDEPTTGKEKYAEIADELPRGDDYIK